MKIQCICAPQNMDARSKSKGLYDRTNYKFISCPLRGHKKLRIFR